MARTQTFSIRDFSGGMVKGVGDRDLAPNEMSDFRGFDNKKRTALIPMHSLHVGKIDRADGEPATTSDDPTNGYVLSDVPLGSYGCYGFGTDHQLESSTPTTYAFTSDVEHTGRSTKWIFDIDYDWVTIWAGTTWKVDLEGYGTIGTFTAQTGATHDSTGVPPQGWTIKINDTIAYAKTAITGSNTINLNVVVIGMTTPSGVTATSAGTNNDDAKMTITATRHGSEYADLEMSMYSTTSNPPPE